MKSIVQTLGDIHKAFEEREQLVEQQKNRAIGARHYLLKQEAERKRKAEQLETEIMEKQAKLERYIRVY